MIYLRCCEQVDCFWDGISSPPRSHRCAVNILRIDRSHIAQSNPKDQGLGVFPHLELTFRYTTEHSRCLTLTALSAAFAQRASDSRFSCQKNSRAVFLTILFTEPNSEDELFASLHPHGVKYTPEHEGAFWLYNTNAPGGSGSFPGGGTHTYIWEARESSGPTEASGADSNLW